MAGEIQMSLSNQRINLSAIQIIILSLQGESKHDLNNDANDLTHFSASDVNHTLWS